MAESKDMTDMRALIASLRDQMAEALSVSVERPPSSNGPFRGVVVLGMGGSGIGGAILADVLREGCQAGWIRRVWWWRRVIPETRKKRSPHLARRWGEVAPSPQ